MTALGRKYEHRTPAARVEDRRIDWMAVGSLLIAALAVLVALVAHEGWLQ